MKKDILDLRFIIGSFFGLVGILLVIASLTMSSPSGKSETTNFWSGIVYVVFSVIMIFLWYNGNHTEEPLENDKLDILEE